MQSDFVNNDRYRCVFSKLGMWMQLFDSYGTCYEIIFFCCGGLVAVPCKHMKENAPFKQGIGNTLPYLKSAGIKNTLSGIVFANFFVENLIDN